MFVLLFSLLFAWILLSELNVRYVFLRGALSLPFVLAAVPLLFTTAGAPLFILHLGDWALTATFAGLDRFLGIALKSWMSVQVAIVLAATTRFPDLLHAMRAMGIPRLLVAMFGLMWRYVFVLVDEAIRLLRARTARSGIDPHSQPARGPGGTLAWRGHVAGGMAGSLFLRGLDRSERIYAAMLSRGYDGEVRSLDAAPMRPADRYLVASGGLLLAALLAFGLIFWG